MQNPLVPIAPYAFPDHSGLVLGFHSTGRLDSAALKTRRTASLVGLNSSLRDDRPARTPAFQTIAVIFAIIAALYVGRSFAIPVAIAVLISFSLGPLVTWLRRQGFGRFPSVATVIVPALLALIAFSYLIVTQLGSLAGDLPAYQTNVERKVRSLESFLPAQAMLDKGSAFISNLRETRSLTSVARQRHDQEPLPVEIKEPNPTPLTMLTGVAIPLLGPLAQLAIAILFVIFFLAERETLRDRMIRLAGSGDLHRTTMAMDEASHRVSRFLLSQLAVNSCFGTALGLGLWAIGVPNPALWGSLAVVLRFVPYLGVVAASIVPLVLAVAVDPGWSMLLWSGALFIGLELVTANIVEPWLYGSSTGLSSVAFVVSAIFWTWLWGAVGLLIATPLTVCIAVLGRHVPQLTFLHILLGNEAPLKPEESFYQRLLAGHPEEAAQQAEEHLKSGGALLAFCDDIILPALALAERDRTRGVLDHSGRAQILDGVRAVVEDLAEDVRNGDSGALEHNVGSLEGSRRRILCIPGRTALDEAAAITAALLLSLRGHEAHVASVNSARAGARDAERGSVPQTLLSYMDHGAVLHAKYVSRRVRRLFGTEAEILAGFWAGDEYLLQNPEVIESAGLDGIVTSFRAALDKVESAAAPPSHEFPARQPELDELAKRASQAVATPSAQVLPAELDDLPLPSGAAR